MFKPNKNKIVIERLVEETDIKKELDKLGFVAPQRMETSKVSNKAIVTHVGYGEDIDSSGIKVGDVVYLSKYSGIPIKLDEKELLMISIEEILGFNTED